MALIAVIFALSCVELGASVFITDASHKRTLSFLVLGASGEVLNSLQTNVSTLNEYTNGIADPSTRTVYCLISKPPGIIKSNRTYAIASFPLSDPAVTQHVSGLFHIPGVYPYGITLGPDGLLIVSGQANTIMVYYLIDPVSGESTELASIDIQNGFIFPDAMIYNPASDKLYHPYCDEPEHFIGMIVVDVHARSAALVKASSPSDWFRPVVFDASRLRFVGLLRTPHSDAPAHLASFSLSSGNFSALGPALNETTGYTFKGADISLDSSELIVTASKGLLGSAESSVFAIKIADGSLAGLRPFPSPYSAEEFLTIVRE
jgi:hypothetical protein